MITVTAAIIRKGDAVLLARRKQGQRMAGFWEFPGGKLEEGETLQACIEREIFEELNWNIKAGEVIAKSTYVYTHGSILLMALEAEILAGTPAPAVHDKIEWVPIPQLLSYQLAPADIPIAKELMRI